MEIEVIYEPNFRDYFRLVRRVAIKRLRSFLVALIVVPLALVVFIATQPQQPNRPAPSPSKEVWNSLFIPVGFAVALFAGTYYSARKQWSKAPDLRETRRIVVTETGFEVRGITFSGQTEWINIAEGEKVGDLYILRSRGGAYYLFPKKIFSSDSQLQEFLKIARRKMGKSFLG